MPAAPVASRRAHRAFWVLTLVASVAMGAVSAALGSTPGSVTGAAFAVAGVVLVSALALAARVLFFLERSSSRREQPPG